MTDPPASPNEFERDKPGTSARSDAEAAVEALRQRGGIFVEAVRATRMAMALTDPTLAGNPIVFANQSFLTLSGYSMEEVLGQQPHFLNGPDTDPEDAERFRRMLEEDRDGAVETVQYAKDGRRFVATVLLTAFKEDEGKTLHHLLSWADITRRGEAEGDAHALRTTHAALRQSEAKYRTLFETMGQGYCELELVRDKEGRAVDQFYLELNPAFERMFGIPVAEAKGRKASELFAGLEPIWTETLARVAETGTTERAEHEMASLRRWFEVSAYPGAGDRVVVLYADITDRKGAEIALRESDERQRFLLMLSDRLRTEVDARAIALTSVSLLADHMRLDRACIAQVDKGRDLAEIGPEYRRPDLAPVDGVITLSNFPEAFAHAQATTLVLADVAADPTLSDGDKHGFAEFRMGALIVASARKGTRNPVWALLVASEQPRRWRAAEVALVEETAERTWAAMERARAEAALRESEERLRLIVENARDYAIFTTAPEGRINQWYEGAAQVFGWSAEEAMGQLADITFTPEDRANDEPAKEREGAAREGWVPNVRWHIRKDGKRIFIEGIASALRDSNGALTGFLKIGQDVTERRRAEEHQRTLLAELQHRVRNTLGVIRSIVRRTAELSGSVEEMSSHLQGRIAAFSRVQAAVTRTPGGAVDLAALIEEELLAHAARESERLTVKGAEIALRARPAETLSLAIHELATNAVKYGVLSDGRGGLSVRWRREQRNGFDWLAFTWEEHGLDLPEGPPERRGFGLELLERTLPYELSAETRVEFGRGGLCFTFEAPLEMLEARP
jgi:PAS domain S-box-containing protein